MLMEPVEGLTEIRDFKKGPENYSYKYTEFHNTREM
jgi:hypothetical protein